MRESFGMNPALAQRISIFEVGLANENREGSHVQPGNGSIDPGARIVGDEFTIRTIDSLVAEGALSKVDFIKMDV